MAQNTTNNQVPESISHTKFDPVLGLTNLKHLGIKLNDHANTDTRIEAGTFNGLDDLESLSVALGDGNYGSNEGMPDKYLPSFDGMQGLNKLDLMVYTHKIALTKDQFSPLPELTTLDMRLNYPSSGEPETYRLPSGIFDKNTKLEFIRIETGYGKLTGDQGIFAHLDNLLELRLSHRNPDGFAISLSPDSPLLKLILSERESPIGFTLIP